MSERESETFEDFMLEVELNWIVSLGIGGAEKRKDIPGLV